MKGKFDAYVLWPLAKKFQNWIVDRSTARDFTVGYNPNIQTFPFKKYDFFGYISKKRVDHSIKDLYSIT